MEGDKIHRCPQNKKNILYTFGEKEKHKEYIMLGTQQWWFSPTGSMAKLSTKIHVYVLLFVWGFSSIYQVPKATFILISFCENQ